MSSTGVANPSEFPKSVGIKCGPPMLLECCVKGCGAKYGQVNVSFHRFPTIQTARDARRRELWIEAAGLPNNMEIVDSALICGRHFEKGKPSLPTETRHANYAPTLNLKSKQVVPIASPAASDSASMSMNTVTPQRPQKVASVPLMAPQIIPKDVHLPAFCRLCLAEDVNMVFPKDSKVYHQLTDKLRECLNLEVSIGELSCSLICKKCYETLEQMHQFRTRCARQNNYLKMRKSLEPDRNQPLRYKDNWYWYSCLGNGMNSIIWGCSVVCCPAFIVSHPSGKICSRYANHQHKQKMDDVKSVYCNGEYIYDGFRYSFQIINSNRTLSFSCRNLHDPYKTCPAGLITNDRSEVLSIIGKHNHQREIIIESAIKDGLDGAKKSITLIRGVAREIVICQGFWYTTLSEQDSVSNWNCIRYDCRSTIAMVDGIVRFFGAHAHPPVFLKWGAQEEKNVEPKGPTLMKVVNPSTAKSLPARVVPTAESTANLTNSNESQPPIKEGSLLNAIKVEPPELPNVPKTPCHPAIIVRPPAPNSSPAIQPTRAAYSPKVVVRSNHPIPVVKRSPATMVRVPPPPLQRPPPVVPPKPSVPVFEQTIPKIVHVMSLNLNHSSNQPKQTIPEPATEPESNDQQTTIKQEPMDEPETITDEVQPTALTPDPCANVAVKLELPKPPPLTPRPMTLVSSAAVISDNMLSVTNLDVAFPDANMSLATTTVPTVANKENGNSLPKTTGQEEQEDCLSDLQDDEEIPPIVPIDAELEQRIIGQEYSTRVLANGKTQVVRKIYLSRNSNRDGTGSSSGHRRSLNPGYNGSIDVGTLSLNRQKATRIYGPSSGAQKRIHQVVPIENPNIKKPKCNELMPPLETTIVDTEKYIESAGVEQDQSPAEDPIAVSTEPHQNWQSDADDDNGEEEEAEEEDKEEEQQEDTEDRSSSGDLTNQNTINESLNMVSIPASTETTAEQKSDSPVPEQSPQMKPQTSSDPPVYQSDKKLASKTVQLVKLQKTEQMLSHEGHLYKIKWHNRRRIYWDCMLREQVNCNAILETQTNNTRFWNQVGSHNHKVPKPIINDDNRGRYQMLTNDIADVNVKKLPGQSMKIDEIEEQEGRMMHLVKRKVFNFKIQKRGRILLTLSFANYEYKIINAVDPGFRWKCNGCSNVLETDEKFTIAREVGSIPHNHEPKVTVINLVDDGTLVDASSSNTAETSSSSQQPEIKSPEVVEDTKSDDPNETAVTASPAVKSTHPAPPDSDELPTLPTSKPGSDVDEDQPAISENVPVDTSTDELKKTSEHKEEVSDDEEMVLDPSTGEICKSGDLKRKQYRKAILENIVADDDDDDAEYLDPLTGKMRRKGDKSLSEEPLEDEGNAEINESIPQSETPNISIDDFEELLNPDSKEAKKPKKPKKNSLAALKLVVKLHSQLKNPDSERNFEVLPSSDDSACLIRFSEFIYELDTIEGTYSVWKCHLSPQYACRGKVHLSTNCKQISVSGVNHCHVPTLKDMFIDRPAHEEGQIKDTDQDKIREYTFIKRSDHTCQLKLDDGYLYNCITISKTGVSCWRCVSRQSSNCKAIITMEGVFESMTRNRFSHSHGPVSEEDAKADGADGNDSVDKDSSLDSPPASNKRPNRSENEADRKKKKRQTV